MAGRQAVGQGVTVGDLWVGVSVVVGSFWPAGDFPDLWCREFRSGQSSDPTGGAPHKKNAPVYGVGDFWVEGKSGVGEVV